MRNQRHSLRLATGGAIVLTALAATMLAALPAAAASGVEIEESGDVKVRVDTSGKWFEEGTEYVEINGDIGSSEEFVLSWERPDLQWQSPDDLGVYITGDYDDYLECQMDGARDFVKSEGVKSWADFKARWGVGDSWDFTASEWADIQDECGESLWDVNTGTLDWTGDTTFMARVPVSLLGSGEVDIFIQPLRGDSVDPTGSPMPECIIADYPSDTVWSNCHYVLDGSATEATINIIGSSQAPTEPTETPSTAPSADPVETDEPAAAPEESSGMPMWLLIVIIVGVVLIGGIIALLLVLGRSKNKAPAQGEFQPYGAPTGYADPNAYGQQPPTGAYGAPSQPYGQDAPTQAYGAPAPQQPYGQPAPYGQDAPTQAYGAPAPQQPYGQQAPAPSGPDAPTQAYTAPQPYGQPAPGVMPGQQESGPGAYVPEAAPQQPAQPWPAQPWPAPQAPAPQSPAPQSPDVAQEPAPQVAEPPVTEPPAQEPEPQAPQPPQFPGAQPPQFPGAQPPQFPGAQQ